MPFENDDSFDVTFQFYVQQGFSVPRNVDVRDPLADLIAGQPNHNRTLGGLDGSLTFAAFAIGFGDQLASALRNSSFTVATVWAAAGPAIAIIMAGRQA